MSDMFDVKNKTCIFSGCDMLPCYGNKGGKRQHCFKHRLPGMINVVTKICEYDDYRLGSMNIKGNPGRTNKLDGMKNLTIKYCESNGCNITALFGFRNKTPQYCVAHKLPEMVDVVHDKCEFGDCTVRASFLPLLATKEIHCREHATRNEYSLKRRNPMCTFSQCQNKACYFHSLDVNLYPVRCDLHKLPCDIELDIEYAQIAIINFIFLQIEKFV